MWDGIVPCSFSVHKQFHMNRFRWKCTYRRCRLAFPICHICQSFLFLHRCSASVRSDRSVDEHGNSYCELHITHQLCSKTSGRKWSTVTKYDPVSSIAHTSTQYYNEWRQRWWQRERQNKKHKVKTQQNIPLSDKSKCKDMNMWIWCVHRQIHPNLRMTWISA